MFDDELGKTWNLHNWHHSEQCCITPTALLNVKRLWQLQKRVSLISSFAFLVYFFADINMAAMNHKT